MAGTSLQAARTPGQDADARPREHAALPRRGADGDAGTILVVDDEAIVRRVLTTVLSRAGFEVQACGGVSEARQLLADRLDPVDLVITDMVMPGGSGLEIVEYVAARHPGTRVVLMSGYGDAGGQVSPAAAFLQKPFTAAELERCVRAVFDDGR